MRIALTVILYLALAVHLASADNKVSAPDFSGYAQTEAFQFFIGGLTNANGNLNQSNVLTIVSFLGNDQVGLLYRVNEHRQENDVRFVYELAAEDSQSRQLSENQLQELRSAIKKLPAKNAVPPIGQLVVVGFKDNTNWVVRSYNQTNLPPAMHQIYNIIGERFETKKEH